MPKLKTHKGTAKRIKRTASGKLLRGHAFKSHNFEKKSAARKRAYGKTYELTSTTRKNINRMLGGK